MARLAAAAGSTLDRAQDLLEALSDVVPFDAAWLALLGRYGYESLASWGLNTSQLESLTAPAIGRGPELPAPDSLPRPPSPLRLSGRTDDVPVSGQLCMPAGIHEVLSMALLEPGGRHVGFLTLLFGDTRPPDESTRRRLAQVAPLVAQGIDPMRSLTSQARLVSDAFAGVLVMRNGETAPLPGLPGNKLLEVHSQLLTTMRARLITGEIRLAFLWPSDPVRPPRRHVRVTYLAASESPNADTGLVLLSSAGPVHGLTARELEVLGMIVEGYSNQQISHCLTVTIRTVATHVEHILAKLSASTRTHAAVRAQREGTYVPVSTDSASLVRGHGAPGPDQDLIVSSSAPPMP